MHQTIIATIIEREAAEKLAANQRATEKTRAAVAAIETFTPPPELSPGAAYLANLTKYLADFRERYSAGLEYMPGDLYSHRDGEYIREATQEETDRSIEAADHDGGIGVFSLDGRSVFVSGGMHSSGTR